MADRKTPPADTRKVPDLGTNLLILGTIADTTWRMFTPVIGFLLLGMFIDSNQSTRPWFTIGGVLLGFIFAILLVWRQYRSIDLQPKNTDDGAS